MAGRVTTVTALLLLVITRVSGGGQPFFFYSGAPAPVVPQFYVYDTQLVAAPVAPEPARSGVPLPCPAEGFHRHPTNCSRFYRCVDYAGTGQYFSRYEFQCPPGQMFLSVGKDTCVPGDCAGVVPLPAAPVGAVDPGNYGQGGSGIPPSTGHVGDDPGSYPQPVTAPQPTESAAPVAGGAYPQPGGSPPAGSAGVGPVVVGSYQTQSPPTEAPTPPAGTGGSAPPAYPQPGEVATPAYPEQVTAAPTPQVGYPEPVTPAPPPPPVGYPEPVTPAPQPPSVAYPQPGGGDGGCPARYVQDSQFCNIYHRCPDDRERFLCISGTVFDQARQMCRINDREDVCFGKQMYFPSAAFRADFPQLNQGGPAQLVGEQTFPSFTQGQSLPLFSQGQPSPAFSRGQSLPLFSQVQSFPEFSQGQPLPLFSQGQPLPLFSQGQPFPTFDQGQTFQSFDQEPTFPATQRLGYTAQIPSYSEVSGVPQFAASDFVSGQGTSFYAQPSYIVPNYFVSSK